MTPIKTFSSLNVNISSTNSAPILDSVIESVLGPKKTGCCDVMYTGWSRRGSLMVWENFWGLMNSLIIKGYDLGDSEQIQRIQDINPLSKGKRHICPIHTVQANSQVTYLEKLRITKFSFKQIGVVNWSRDLSCHYDPQ